MKPRYAFLLIGLMFLMNPFGVGADSIKNGPRPGEKDPLPASKRVLFSDDELFVLYGDTNDLRMYYYALSPKDDALKSWAAQSTSHDFEYPEFGRLDDADHWPPVASAKGRFTRHDIDQVAYAFVRPDGETIGVEIWDAASGRHSNSGTIKTEYMSWFDGQMDIAVGDLDRIVDEEGFSHDEIVVTRFGKTAVLVDVLDAGLSPVANIEVPFVPKGDLMFWLSSTLGDVNGDGNLEIAVLQAISMTTIQVNILTYDASDNVPKLVNESSFKTENNGNYTDIVAGDFNGNGRDDLAMANHARLRLLAVDERWQIHEMTQNTFNVGGSNLGMITTRLAAGLLRFSPADGYNFNRRQLALCSLAMSPPRVKCRAIQVAEDYTTSDVCYDMDTEKGTCKTKCTWTMDLTGWSGMAQMLTYMDLSTGNFIGHGIKGEMVSPLDQIAVYFHYLNGNGYWVPRVHVILPGEDCTTVHAWDGPTGPKGGFTPPQNIIALSAADIDGDSFVLGDPVHVKAVETHILDYVIQEPPKHMDYLPEDPSATEGDWGVFNVSGNSKFYVELKDTSGITFDSSAQDNTSWSIGGSASEKVDGTVKFGAMDILGVELSASSKTKVSYNYDASKSAWNSQYGSRSVSFTSQTNSDDFIAFKLQDMDIWRYKVLGYTTPDEKAPNGYMDIIMPGPMKSFKVGGMTQSEWYQPVHQNRNILSYPSTEAQDFPPNLGSFTLPDGTEVKQTMNEMDIYSFDRVSQSLDVAWTKAAGSGSEKNYKHTLGESEDVKIGVKGKALFEWGTVKASSTTELNFNNENSWGGKSTEKCTTSESKGIKINVPTIASPQQSYNFKSAVYIDSGTGALKVAHAADPLGSSEGEQWWRNQYGRLPDPALNLPNRFVEQDEDDWVLNTDTDRMHMRGFFMRRGEVSEATGIHEILGGPPVDGDKVQLCARVYNFALFDPTGEFEVCFDRVQIDQSGFEVEGTREGIGSVRTSLDSLEQTTDRSMKEVCVDWDTTGMASNNGYRFYVILDPQGEVDELHEWKDASGERIVHGNNEGYWPWGDGIHVLDQETPRAGDPNPFLSIDWGKRTNTHVKAIAGKEYRLRAYVHSDAPSSNFHNVIFSDGSLDDGQLIAMRRLSIIEGDTSVSASWTPRTTGVRKLVVHVMESADTPENDQDNCTMTVTVFPPGGPSTWRDRILYRMLPEL